MHILLTNGYPILYNKKKRKDGTGYAEKKNL